ncbi:glucuronate isomerase [Enterococcus gallinarum]|uniref:glucuronate isomerase n=1 Tax=Enterococcus gallinarum TaxID=1353 RepID=UPI0024985D05|nr:glucuronate isomerase [Enterococcus gallinarum]GMG58555.1 glucuronate isomerase [Enterococcus gallinarum]
MFLNDDFLLTNDFAKDLYHQYAKKMPIIDYHCHLDPQEIYDDHPFRNITEAWLAGDHYKWRLMRACGVDESLITGEAADYDKFIAWCQTVPKIIGNPLYVWTHLELKRFFGVDLMINEENAPEIWQIVNQKLQSKTFSRREIIANSNVQLICTTNDPTDSLAFHRKLANEESRFRVLPTFRPDKALNIQQSGFNDYIDQLATVVGHRIDSYEDLLTALDCRITFFHQMNCRLSDHALDHLHFLENSVSPQAIFEKARNQEIITEAEAAVYRSALLLHLFEQYHNHDWTMQLHLHAYRNCNTNMLNQLGPDTGYDGINDQPITGSLQALLDAAERKEALPQTILYSLNPNDYDVLVALMGCYQKESKNKIQLGSGWWYNDTRAGMRQQLTKFADGSVLANFVGMLTDSRSFLSYTRHEYFRRVFCEWLGELILRGEAPCDTRQLKEFVEGICYQNAADYFDF